MYTVAVGIDIVSVKRMRTLLEMHFDRLLETVFGPIDVEGLPKGLGSLDTLTDSNRKQVCRGLALKFAAKEAAIKALGVPMTTGIEYNQLAVQGGSQFTVQLTPSLSRLARRKSIIRLIGSGSVSNDYAVAAVSGESDDR